jgi:ureidoglycolate lyase
MKLRIEELTSQTFAPFGKVIEQPSRPVDAEGPGWKWWGENIVLHSDRSYAIGYLDLKPAELSFDWAERHMHSDELILPTGGDCLIYVGQPDFLDEPAHLPGLEHFHVFRIHSGQGALISEGVWHGAPMAIDRPLNVVILLAYGSGREDAHVVKFEHNPIIIDW